MIELRNGSDVSLIGFMGGDDQVCMSAWVSFGQDHEERLENRTKVEALINFLYRNKHMTPFESSIFTFRVTTPIFVVREIMRHRSASYNEWSGRYSEMIPSFYIAPRDRPLVQQGKPGDYYFIQGTDDQYAIMRTTQNFVCNAAWNAYQRQLDAGIAKEVARDILPLSTYTQFYVTMNARNLMHFIGLRSENHALYEIREVSDKMRAVFAEKMPLTSKAFESTLVL